MKHAITAAVVVVLAAVGVAAWLHAPGHHDAPTGERGDPIHPPALYVPGAGDDVDPRVRALLPDEGDRKWEQLPWYHDLLAARAAAERTGAPIFMWIMDGNPLGPT